MTNQTQCNTCKYARLTSIFALCTHETSAYTVADRTDFHTQTHVLKFMPNRECNNYARGK